jgi:arylsulfatase
LYKKGWDKVRQERYDRMKRMGIINTDLSGREPKVNVTYEHLMPDSILLDSLGEGEVLFPVPWESLTEEQKDFQATKMAIHAAMVDRIDQEVGRLVEELKSEDLFDNTVIFFLSDNGASAEIMIRGGGHDPEALPGSYASYLCLGPGYANASNSPFRRYKHWTHEGGVATPLVVHWPDKIKAKATLRENTGHVVDLLPTLVELAGGELISKKDSIDIPELHGKSLVPVFSEDYSVDRDFIFFSHEGNQALRIKNWKIVTSKSDSGKWFLYDMSTDRAEQVDLSEEYPDTLQEMIDKWTLLKNEYREMGGYE